MSRIAPDLAAAIDTARHGQRVMVRCPAHEDGSASLSVAPGSDQPVVMFCHAGCQTEDILNAFGINWDDISAALDQPVVQELPSLGGLGQATHRYEYKNDAGRLIFEVLRFEPPGQRKQFRQRRPNAGGGWEWNLQGVTRVLYRQAEVRECIAAGSTIYVVEGEKDAETLVSLGLCATTNSGGAGKWEPQYTEVLAGADVVLISDADETGRAHARQVKDFLIEAGCTVEIRESGHEKDITDHLTKGYAFSDLLVTSPAEKPMRVASGVDVLDIIERSMDQVEFIIPGVLARGDRMLITGFEGHGKSTFLRQCGVQVACGLDPWSLAQIPPKKVMVLDFENHPDQVLTSYQELVGMARYHQGDDAIARGNLIVFEEWDNDDTDLLLPSGVAWLQERVQAYQPDLVVMGPLMNMAGRDLKDDEVVRKIKMAVNKARSICGTAFIMEHHAPHKEPGAKARSVRPYGSSTFLKFPEFGYGFQPDEDKPGWYEWKKTRFPRIRSRKFPEYMRVGTPNTAEWPWMPATAEEWAMA